MTLNWYLTTVYFLHGLNVYFGVIERVEVAEGNKDGPSLPLRSSESSVSMRRKARKKNNMNVCWLKIELSILSLGQFG